MYAFCQDMPGATLEQQEILQRHIPAEALEGCVVHVVGPYDGGVRMIDVWTDEESYRRFQREVLWPALDRLMPEMGGLDATPPAPFIVHQVTGAAIGTAVGV
jgi:hypothetical protein